MADYAKLDIELPGKDGRLQVRFRVEEYADEDGPPPRHWECLYESSARAISSFYGVILSRGYYLWVLSTAEYEGRARVNLNTGEIEKKFYVVRRWN